MAEILIGNVGYKPAVGMHHIQFAGEPTPATIWADTTWEIDTALQGRTIIGSGGDYVFSATGGEATHTLNNNEIPQYQGNIMLHGVGTGTPISGATGVFTPKEGQGKYAVPTTNPNAGSYAQIDFNIGGGQAHNIMQPYLVVNFWKRTA